MAFRKERESWELHTREAERRVSGLNAQIKTLEARIDEEKHAAKAAVDRYDRLKAALLTFTDANGADSNGDERWKRLISAQVGSVCGVHQDVAHLVALMLQESEAALRKREQDLHV